MTDLGWYMALAAAVSPVLMPLLLVLTHIGDKSEGAQRYVARGAMRGGVGFALVLLAGLPFILWFGP